jgi:hypothetical protein
MRDISNLYDNTVAFRKQVNRKPRQTLAHTKNVMSTFEPDSRQELLQNLNVRNQTRKAETVADQLISPTEISWLPHVQVNPSSLKPLKPS